MSQTEALESTIEALRAKGVLEPVDESLVATAKGLAAAVDANPDNAALWREFRAAQQALRGLTVGDADDYDALVRDLHAAMGDA